MTRLLDTEGGERVRDLTLYNQTAMAQHVCMHQLLGALWNMIISTRTLLIHTEDDLASFMCSAIQSGERIQREHEMTCFRINTFYVLGQQLCALFLIHVELPHRP